jgi:hypothetical protein
MAYTPSPKELELIRLIRPLPEATWQADYPMRSLESGLEGLAKDFGAVNMTPDFQRGHVWTDEQRKAFCEALIRKAIPQYLLMIQFNCPHWHREVETDLPREIQCVDGLQRLTTIRRMLAGDIRPFGLHINEFDETTFSVRRIHFCVRFCMHNFKTRKELLQYYYDINAGGTPHTAAELEKIRSLLSKA